MVGKDLKIEPVAKHIVSGGAYAEYFLTHNRLIHIFNKLPGKGFIVAYRQVESEIKVTLKGSLSSAGLEYDLDIIETVACTNYYFVYPCIGNLVTGKVQRYGP